MWLWGYFSKAWGLDKSHDQSLEPIDQSLKNTKVLFRSWASKWCMLWLCPKNGSAGWQPAWSCLLEEERQVEKTSWVFLAETCTDYSNDPQIYEARSVKIPQAWHISSWNLPSICTPVRNIAFHLIIIINFLPKYLRSIKYKFFFKLHVFNPDLILSTANDLSNTTKNDSGIYSWVQGQK